MSDLNLNDFELNDFFLGPKNVQFEALLYCGDAGSMNSVWL